MPGDAERCGLRRGGLAADSASDVGTPSSVLSKVRAQPITVRASVIRPARRSNESRSSWKKKGRAENGAPQS